MLALVIWSILNVLWSIGLALFTAFLMHVHHGLLLGDKQKNMRWVEGSYIPPPNAIPPPPPRKQEGLSS